MAIDPKETKNSLFGGLKKEIVVSQQERSEAENIEISPREVSVAASAPEPQAPKWQSFDKVTALLTTGQKEGLDRVAKKIMKFRSRDLRGVQSKERVTANTILRALVENFLQLEESMQMEVLTSEEDVYEWIKRLLNRDLRS